MIAWLKTLFLMLTKPFWCSASGLYQVYQLKKYERQLAQTAKQKEK